MIIKTIKIKKPIAILLAIGGFLFFAAPSASAGWTSGKFGSAISFNGTSNYVSSNTALPAVSAFSYSLWFKSSDGAFAADEYLFSQGTNDPSVYLESMDNKVKVMADGADILFSVKTVNDTGWHHLEIAADGTNLKLYLDGILESSTAYTGSSAASYLYVASSAVPGSYFGGLIDEVKVYAYARTASEILADYNDGKAAHLGKNNQRDDGLVGYWNMEEGKGQTVYDRSGNANNGTLGSSTSPAKDDPVFTTGYSSFGPGGTGLQFDGVDDYVDAGNGASLNTGTILTVSAWFRLDVASDAGFIVSKMNDAFTVGWALQHSGNDLAFYQSASNAALLTISNIITDTNWHHAAVVINGSGNNTLYFDGAVVDTDAKNVNINSTATLKIGVKVGTYVNYTDGTIDSVRIYNRALSADEIRQHYNQKKPVMEMKFDEGSGQKAYDESFNNNDGWLGGTSAVEATDPTWTTGKFGSGLSFDGSNDYVETSYYPSDSPKTLSFWFNPDTISKTYNAIGVHDVANHRLYLGLSTSYIYCGIGTGYTITVPSGMAVGTWYYMTVTADGAVATIYINGVQKTSFAYTQTGSSTQKFWIGGINNAALAYPKLGGKIDSVRIYNYARTPAEILVDYNNGLAGHLR